MMRQYVGFSCLALLGVVWFVMRERVCALYYPFLRARIRDNQTYRFGVDVLAPATMIVVAVIGILATATEHS